ncbi:MAG TPA: coenzyme F420-0:L-glutamate ligase [Candidatus Nealsonbacteria bacterium]|uniref:Coenzyme F420:L-glutamate ligase-like domain-containing protein n=1 Tax=marine sediment metagenome TaxID=412755 RepID=A0A0F9VFL9_9ZZZZ|nr:coenzyme F420-0:L-glutamate ligase [Candidatus Nealsonbacteria bacterium]
MAVHRKKGGVRMEKGMYRVTFTAIPGIPLIQERDDLGSIIVECAKSAGLKFQDKDILVVTSKIVSKAENRLISLKTVQPSRRAHRVAEISGKDPKIVELMMKEGNFLEVRHGVIVTVHRLGFICTSAGIDKANTGYPEEELVSMLPENPDKSAGRIRKKIEELTGKKIGVLINDSLGVQYRNGSIGMTVGLSGFPALLRSSSGKDLYQKKRNICISFADEIAAAASLLMGQGNVGIPVVLARGLRYPRKSGHLRDLIAAEQIKNGLKKKKGV